MNVPNLHSEQNSNAATSPGLCRTRSGSSPAARSAPAAQSPPGPQSPLESGQAGQRPSLTMPPTAPTLPATKNGRQKASRTFFKSSISPVIQCSAVGYVQSARHVRSRAMRSVRNHDDPISLAVEKVHAGMFSHWNPSRASVPATGPNRHTGRQQPWPQTCVSASTWSVVAAFGRLHAGRTRLHLLG